MKHHSSYALLLPAVLLLVGGGCVRVQQTTNTGGEIDSSNSEMVNSETTATIAVDTAPVIKSHVQTVVDGMITIDEITLPLDGWVVVYTDDNGKPGKIVGKSFFNKGTYGETKMEVDQSALTNKIYLIAHADEGASVQFEFPGPDVAMEMNGTVPAVSLMLSGDVMIKENAEDNQGTAKEDETEVTEGGNMEAQADISTDVMIKTESDAGETTVDVQADAGAMLQTNVTVNIEKFSFPVEVRVKKGTTVTWTNRDSAGHTVTSDAGAFGSALLDTGSSFSFTFDTVGRFPYHCAPHPSMTGTVVVE